MLRLLSKPAVRLVNRCLPDPFVAVLLLTFIVFAGGVLLRDVKPEAMLQLWGDGFWKLLGLSMQILLMLVAGYTVASSPLFQRLTQFLAKVARTPTLVIITVTLISVAASWVHLAFGLVMGAMVGRQLARQVNGIDYRLLMASAYSGLIAWQAGLSGSVASTISGSGHSLANRMGVYKLEETIFSTFNLTILGAVVVVLVLANWMMMPAGREAVVVDPKKLADKLGGKSVKGNGPGSWLDNNIVLGVVGGALGLAFVTYYFIVSSGAMNMHMVMFSLLFLGLILHGRPAAFLGAANQAVRSASGIIVQFPFYAGILAMLTGTGLVNTAAGWFVALSNGTTLPLFTFLGAGLINIFVPFGDAQWALQAPAVISAAINMKVDLVPVSMAVAWGDAWGNLIQPFWALPALAIAGLKARDIMGFCLVNFLLTGIVIGACLTFLPA